MSYRTRRRIPYVHALSSGLGATAEAPTPWYGELLSKIADPLSGALSQRIAYGKQTPYYGYGSTPPPTYYSGGGPGDFSSFGGFGGISPTMLLLGGAALVAMMMLRK